MKHRVYLGIGSNIEPESHIARGLAEIAAGYELLRVSSLYRSAAVGFDGPPFLNCVAELATGCPLAELAAQLRAIEVRYGRSEQCGKFSSRRLDLDILTYDSLCGVYHGISLPRDEIAINAYVLCPFSEIAGDLVVPGARASLAALWANHDKTRQPLERVDFRWGGRALPLMKMSRASVAG